MYVHGESLSIVAPDKQRIPRKNNIKKTSDTPIKGIESIQVPYKPSKRAKQDSIRDAENNNNNNKTPTPF